MMQQMPVKRLRLGLLLDDAIVCNWEYEMIKRILNDGYAEVAVIILNSSKGLKDEGLLQGWGSFYRKNGRKLLSFLMKKNTNLFFTKIFNAVDFCFLYPNAFSPRSICDLCANVPIVKVVLTQKKYSDFFELEDVLIISRYNLDILIGLGFRMLRGDILRVAKYGVWSYHHGDSRANRGGPAGFWETIESWPTIGSTLQILTEDLNDGVVIYRSLSGVSSNLISLNKNFLYWKTLSFMPRKIKELVVLGEEKFFERVRKENQDLRFYDHRLYREPSSWELFKLIIKKSFRRMYKIITSPLFLNQWILLFDIRKGISTSLWRFRPIVPPPDYSWADPHVIFKNGVYYVFIEEYCHKLKRGHISCVQIDNKGNYKLPEKIIEGQFHFSNPFIFEWRGEYYMIPETAERRTVELYHCKKFPNQWEFVMNLMENVCAVDASVFYYKNKWWLFANLVENQGASSWDELFLFFADDFRTREWNGHLKNPIISDATKARPAGRLFYYNGYLYRPSQNCGKRYGYGLNFNKIKQMSEVEYEEEVVSNIFPLWDKKIQAVHTFSYDNNLTIIDGQIKRWKFNFIK